MTSPPTGRNRLRPPAFAEYTVVLAGSWHPGDGGFVDVRAGRRSPHAGERVRYRRRERAPSTSRSACVLSGEPRLEARVRRAPRAARPAGACWRSATTKEISMGGIVIPALLRRRRGGGAERDGGVRARRLDGSVLAGSRGRAVQAGRDDGLGCAVARSVSRATGSPPSWPHLEEFADKFNSTEYVVSSTLETPEWSNTTVLRGDVDEEVTKLKQRYEVTSSCTAARSSRRPVEHDLVDALHLQVYPVIVGAGRSGSSPARARRSGSGSPRRRPSATSTSSSTRGRMTAP